MMNAERRRRLNAGLLPARGASEEGVVYITFTLCKPEGRRGGVRQGLVPIMSSLSERRARKPSDRKGNWVPWHEACRPPSCPVARSAATRHAEAWSRYGLPNEIRKRPVFQPQPERREGVWGR